MANLMDEGHLMNKSALNINRSWCVNQNFLKDSDGKSLLRKGNRKIDSRYKIVASEGFSRILAEASKIRTLLFKIEKWIGSVNILMYESLICTKAAYKLKITKGEKNGKFSKFQTVSRQQNQLRHLNIATGRKVTKRDMILGKIKFRWKS